MALYAGNELLMVSTFHESLSECAVTWFYQLRNIACWEDLAKAFLDWYRYNPKATPNYPGLKNDKEPYSDPHEKRWSDRRDRKDGRNTNPTSRGLDTTHERQSMKNLWDSIIIPQTFLYLCLLQSCTNFSKFTLFPKICIINSKSQKDLFEMHTSMKGTSQHHNSNHGK